MKIQDYFMKHWRMLENFSDDNKLPSFPAMGKLARKINLAQPVSERDIDVAFDADLFKIQFGEIK